MPESTTRINKYIRNAGFCSRREADRLIQDKRIEINGRAAVPGDKVGVNDVVSADGRVLCPKDAHTYIALNKPLGVVCTSNRVEKNNIIDFLGYDGYITYAGRLDKDSTGLILMTDDGDLINNMMRAANRHEKEYICTINSPVSDDFLKKMGTGVHILDTVTRKCRVNKIDERTFSIILTQGLNRQIRRMCEACGKRVVSLKRVRVCSLELGDLLPGEFRFLTEDEVSRLRRDVNL